MFSVEKDIDKLKRKSVRSWFRYNFDAGFGLPSDFRRRYTLDDCFNHYQQYEDFVYEESGESIYSFNDVSEFTDALLDCNDIAYHVTDSHLVGVIQKTNEDYVAYKDAMMKEVASKLTESF